MNASARSHARGCLWTASRFRDAAGFFAVSNCGEDGPDDPPGAQLPVLNPRRLGQTSAGSALGRSVSARSGSPSCEATWRSPSITTTLRAAPVPVHLAGALAGRRPDASAKSGSLVRGRFHGSSAHTRRRLA